MVFLLSAASWSEAKPVKWEYLVVSAAVNTRNLDLLLNNQGAQGWELVAFTRKDVAVFKRPAK